MRFIDYDGNSGLDPRDIATSIAVESAERGEGADSEARLKGSEANAGCATMAAFMALPMLIILLAL